MYIFLLPGVTAISPDRISTTTALRRDRDAVAGIVMKFGCFPVLFETLLAALNSC